MAVRSLHGVGKTTIAALLVLWFAITRDGIVDWKVITTASAWRQLTFYLWPEIHKWAGRIKWDVVGYRGPFTDRELSTLQLKLDTGSAFAVASKNAELIEGAHADSLMYIFDEAKAIPVEIWDAAEGAFASQGKEAYAFAISTPGPPAGRFYEICSRKPGYEDWESFHIRLKMAIKEGRVSREWARNRRRQWGAKSAIYQRRVLGNFAEEEANALVYLEWIERSNDLWREKTKNGTEFPNKLLGLGVDTAGEGKDPDEIVITPAYKGMIIGNQIVWKGIGAMDIVGRIVKFLKSFRGKKSIPIYIDVIGAGGLGVYSRLKELGYNAIAVKGSEKSDMTDETGEIKFANKRAEGYWRVRDFLNPDYGYDLMIPPDDALIGDLTVHTYKYSSTGALLIQSKDEIKSKLGRSPDRGDSLVYACNSFIKRVQEVGVI